ncbi:MAG: transaldolase [Candidatus Omnitrophica bacterium]|nr:transaldolase [Candidatus Omnitrophota bacterium]
MIKTVLHDLNAFGQSIWLDNINRPLLKSGALQELIGKGVMGLTSNPTIFDNAISKSSEYDAAIIALAEKGRPARDIYDELTVQDVKDAASLFLPVYETTGRRDGFVNLEVDPTLALKTKETIADCERLHAKVDMPNVMFKIPATPEGIAAIEELVGRGININATLIFSLNQYIHTAEAYLKGIRAWAARGGNCRNVSSVASVFVSRIDTFIDAVLEEKMAGQPNEAVRKNLAALRGRPAVANTHIIYSRYLQLFSTKEFKQLERQGALPQRALWASTGTKNPLYSDIKYVEELLGRHTVNTVPDKTLAAFFDHGDVNETITGDATKAKYVISRLARAGIDVNAVCDTLLKDGLDAFVRSFNSLLGSIDAKSRALCAKH